jgi:methyl-accepting chemotaxis protein
MLSPRRHRDERGVVGINLAIVIAFALFAVIQLTRTTVAARQIENRVKVIVGEVGPIDKDLDHVKDVDETNRLAAEILSAAKPLSGQAQTIIDTAKSIDRTVVGILDNAQSINGTVHSISGTANALAPVVRSINDGVAAINGRASRAIPIVVGIRQDLNNVLVEVGPGHAKSGGGLSIAGHANSIDCSTAVRGSACGS